MSRNRRSSFRLPVLVALCSLIHALPVLADILPAGRRTTYATRSVVWVAGFDSTLPNSLYLTSKPAFFGNYPWPWVNPTPVNKLKVWTLPARARYDAGTPNAILAGVPALQEGPVMEENET